VQQQAIMLQDAAALLLLAELSLEGVAGYIKFRSSWERQVLVALLIDGASELCIYPGMHMARVLLL